MTKNFDENIKNILKIFTESHVSKDVERIIKYAEKDLNCRIERTNSGGIIYPPLDVLKKRNVPPKDWKYAYHHGAKAYHEIRRFLKRSLGVDV